MSFDESLWAISEPRRTRRGEKSEDGAIRYAARLPSIECPTCGIFGGGWERVLPIECPLEIESELTQLPSATVFPLAEFRRRKEKWEEILRLKGMTVSLRPGYEFLPAWWYINALRGASVYWPFLSMIVNEAVVKSFHDNDITGVSFHPVHVVVEDESTVVDSLGVRIDQSDGPLHPSNYSGQMPHFYEMRILNCADWLPLCQVETCPDCGNSNVLNDIEYRRDLGICRSRKVIHRSQILELDVFDAAGWGHCVMREKAYQLLRRLAGNDIEATPLTIIE